MKTSFEELWHFTDTIPGSFTVNEGRAIYNIVAGLPRESTIVEVGSYLGRSSSLLGQMAAEMGHELSCIDKFVSGYNGLDVEAEFKKNMDRNRVSYQLISWHSRRAVKLFNDHEVDFMFIDGDHLYEGIRDDISLWSAKIKDGGVIAFHDYNSSWSGVRKAVDEFVEGDYEIGVVDSLAIVRK